MYPWVIPCEQSSCHLAPIPLVPQTSPEHGERGTHKNRKMLWKKVMHMQLSQVITSALVCVPAGFGVEASEDLSPPPSLYARQLFRQLTAAE